MKKISLLYRLAHGRESCTLSVVYSLEHDGNQLSLLCYIDASYPHVLPWLQTRNFVAKFLISNETYLPVSDYADYEKTMDVALLREEIVSAIMGKESFSVPKKHLATA